MSARMISKSTYSLLGKNYSPAATDDDCDLWREEGLSENVPGGIIQDCLGQQICRAVE